MSSELIKYPKTMHLPWSPGLQNDDRLMPISPQKAFGGKRVIITEKMDGENTSMYYDHIHARSRDSANHPSRNWSKAFWGSIRHDIPTGVRICGENMFAKHSISYTELESYFLGFGIWEGDKCWDWDLTMEMFQLFNITPVPILYDGVYSRRIVLQIQDRLDMDKQEGYVIRLATSFMMSEFPVSVAKYVRDRHVQTDQLWMLGPIVPNEMKQ